MRKQQHSPSATEDYMAHLRQQIAQAEIELVEREAELVDLSTELHAFRLEYDTRVGRKLESIQALKAEIERCRQRISQRRIWGPDGPPQANYVPVEEQYRRAWQQTPQPSPPPPVESVDTTTEAQIKKLYRRLCLRFHPDLAQDGAEKAQRTELMTAINAAYAARSLVELQALAKQPDRPTEIEPDTDEQRLAALQDRLRQVERRLQEVEQEIDALMHGPEVTLSLEAKFARRQGRDLLAEMAADAEEELTQRQAELDALRMEMERLGLID